jgi:glutathione S-transferase
MLQRGLVPSIKYNGQIITESAIVSQFLADAHPSHLLPASDKDPMYRARLNFFADTFGTKVIPKMRPGAKTDAEKDAAADETVQAIVKEMEPLFDWKGKGPFFGGSEHITLAEVRTP